MILSIFTHRYSFQLPLPAFQHLGHQQFQYLFSENTETRGLICANLQYNGFYLCRIFTHFKIEKG